MNAKLILLLVLVLVLKINTTSVSQSYYELTRNVQSNIGNAGKMQHNNFLGHRQNPTSNIINISDLIANIKKQHTQDFDKSKSHPKFITPVRQIDGTMDAGFYSITDYFDHNALYPDFLLDYNCGNLTYDLPTGYNHAGTDYFLWPFPWKKMYNNEVEIIAAAPGTIVHKQDGFFDLSCGENTENWNGIGILHEDGSTSWYIHMKKNSLTEKPLGVQVDQGEFLGIVGSSGRSFAPHLHFEVYNSDDQLIDPFEGPCNNTIDESWWISQESYKQSAVNRLATNSHLPEFPACPEEEITHEQNTFYPNDSIWLLSYYKNVFFGDTIVVSVFRPGGLLYSTRVWISPTDFFTTSWLWFPLVLKENEPGGEWKYQIVYKGVTYDHKFQFINPQGIVPAKLQQQILLFPNPVSNILTLDILESNCHLFSLKIKNIFGQVIMQNDQLAVKESIFNLDVSMLDSGVYFLELNTTAGLQSVKFFKK